MNLITITVIDRDSSETRTKTFSTESPEQFKDAVQEWEMELPFRRYEIMSDDMDEFSKEIVDVLDELEITH